MENSKPIYLSKIFWVNVAATLAALAGIEGLLPADATKWVLIAVAVINVILRVWFTSQPIK